VLCVKTPHFYPFNRGLISPKALARVDLDRTRLSAEVYNNWVPETVGAMSIRPGTKFMGSSLRDTGAEFIEFVASTTDVALAELTNEKMRIWLGEDAHELALLGRPLVVASVSFSDTGWTNASTGGTVASAAGDLIPTMTSNTTSGVTMTASSSNALGGGLGGRSWQTGDNNNTTGWADTGTFQGGTLPSWLKVDFGAGNTKTVARYTLRAGANSSQLDNVPRSWDFQGNDIDTGSDASWTTLDTGGDQTGWAVSEKREFAVGSPQAFRFYRWNVKEITGGGDVSGELFISEVELFEVDSSTQARFDASGLILNANAIGSRAKATKRVIVDTGDYGVEHSLNIDVSRGPVVLRVGSSAGDDDFISETSVGTGHHNLAFTPSSDFHITFQSDALVNRIVESIAIGDSGTVEIDAPWDTNDLDNIRYDQSADVVYVDCAAVRSSKIERRGTGRSWSVVDYAPNNGPFLAAPSSAARMSVSHFFGNTTLNSDNPFFTVGHVGALIRIFNEGQGGQWRLGALDAKTDAIEVTGIQDTGTGAGSERQVIVSVSGTWSGTIIIERSINNLDFGFNPVPTNFMAGSAATDTGTFSRTINDDDNNIKVWYRARVSAYTSGVPVVAITYGGGGVTGIARVTDYNSNTSVGIEVLSRFSDTGTSDNWQEGYWSDARSFPSAVALHGGRLGHANGGNLFLSVSDDFESFDDATIGDAAPIIRTLGSGPVDNIVYLISLLRLIIGTAGAEIALKSSSLDEPVTPTNSSASAFSTQGSANLRALKMDNRAIVVQRSKQRIFMVGAGTSGATFGDFEGSELTTLIPDLLAAGIVSVAIQRQPDTRIHVALADGTCGLLTYEPQEEIICWYTWSTDGFVERVMSLPGISEDAVFYHIRRTINSVTKRYLEKWAMQAECQGDTGLSYLADCAVSFTDTGRASVLTGFSHLAGKSVVVWSDDTGQSTAGKDLSPGYNSAQTLYTVDTGAGTITLNESVHHAVAGLPYSADWRSAKLAYAAEGGTALAQMKRVAQVAFVLSKTHCRGLQYGSDTGHLDGLPQVIDGGAVVDADKIFEDFDQVAMSMNGTHNADSRIQLRAQAPRPCTVLAIIPSVQTNDRV
jgi:hypothetical protein